MRTVTPAFFKLGNRRMMPTYEVFDFWPMLIQYFSSFNFHNLQLTIMPEFTPTEWMLVNHNNKGDQDWEIYAECVREAMAHHGNFLLWSRPIREKLMYEDLMNKAKDEIIIDGRPFNYPAFRNRDSYMPVEQEKPLIDDDDLNDALLDRTSSLVNNV